MPADLTADDLRTLLESCTLHLQADHKSRVTCTEFGAIVRHEKARRGWRAVGHGSATEVRRSSVPFARASGLTQPDDPRATLEAAEDSARAISVIHSMPLRPLWGQRHRVVWPPESSCLPGRSSGSVRLCCRSGPENLSNWWDRAVRFERTG